MTHIAPKIAAIDVGTNSFHLIVASVNNRGMLQIHAKEKESVRLGSSDKDMKYIQQDAMERGLATLKRFADIAKFHNADVRAVATSAVREAKNKKDFLNKVYEETGIIIEVVSGAEEARLIYMGALHALPLYDQKCLFIDIGGGSTETLVGINGNIEYVHSEKIGAIRMTRRFFDNPTLNKRDIKRCREFIKGDWAPVMKRIKETGFDLVIGTSGTIQNIAAITLSRVSGKIPEILNGTTLNGSDLLDSIKLICKAEIESERAKIQGLDSNRADIIVGGSLILEHAIKELEIDKLLISSYALREGIVFDTVQKMKAISEFKHLSLLRYQTVYDICNRYNVKMVHADLVKNTALKLYDELQHLHGLGDYEREILEAASLLHDVGYLISHDRHHKHSFYIISQCIMPGYTNDEQELIANIARYHRKSHPKLKHENFGYLNEQMQSTITLLAGILRIAEGLDRRHIQILQDVETDQIGKKLIIKLEFNSNDYQPDVEIWGAIRRKDLLESQLKLKIEFEVIKKSK